MNSSCAMRRETKRARRTYSARFTLRDPVCERETFSLRVLLTSTGSGRNLEISLKKEVVQKNEFM
jgi:hypothetical protein